MYTNKLTKCEPDWHRGFRTLYLTILKILNLYIFVVDKERIVTKFVDFFRILSHVFLDSKWVQKSGKIGSLTFSHVVILK